MPNLSNKNNFKDEFEYLPPESSKFLNQYLYNSRQVSNYKIIIKTI